MQQQVSIPTPDGAARAFVFTPEKGEGPWPAVIFFMDGPAIRPALFEMGERLAGYGYYVLLPDMFWRAGAYPPVSARERSQNEAARAWMMEQVNAARDADALARDTKAFLDFIAAQPKAKPGKVGTIGYCMGGAMALRAAGVFPDRVAAAASFHGGGLAIESPYSVHLLAPKIRAKVLVAAADDDPYFDEPQKERLIEVFQKEGVDAEVVTYEGKLHGYAAPDSLAFDAEAYERHWRDMLALFDATLNRP